MLVPLASSGLPIQISNFFHALRVYHDRPHLVNRKLYGATTLFYYNVSFKSDSKLANLINYSSLIYETNKIKSFTKETLKNLFSDILLPYDKGLKLIEITQEQFKTFNQGIVLTVKLLLPKSCSNQVTVEVAIFNYEENYVQFLSASSIDKFLLVAPPFAYKFIIQHGTVQLIVDVEDADTSSGEWLADKLFPKVLKWCEEYDEDRNIIESLGLVEVGMYFKVYKQLKEKYGMKMVEIWPENTDPLKFVYEDIAIASYLICLWDKSPTAGKSSFVDLGCGNGLLVYILNEEGYTGRGIDVRKRKIWDLYPASTHLEEKTIVPSDTYLFPEADWIIGNHSDELTPWIPVIAARSSPKTNFFLLPCCSYNFDGSKYHRKNTSMSQYSEYLNYVEEICTSCGFITKIDKLRIPSTKRTCLVGCGSRTLPPEQISININNLLTVSTTNESNSFNTAGNANQWVAHYQARELAEEVRNCTKLDRMFVNNILMILVKTLLDCSMSDSVLMTKTDGSSWNAGHTLDIVTLVKSLEVEVLKKLKRECGGLQTLMKNHRYIFNVDKGRVKLRPPYLKSETVKYVDKPCWFLKNHPDGCLYNAEECAYSHL